MFNPKNNTKSKIGFSIGILLTIFCIFQTFTYAQSSSKSTVNKALEYISQTSERNQSINSIFNGKPQVSNLYQTAKKIASAQGAGASNASLQQMKLISGLNIDTKDMINILYDRDSSIRTTIKDACKSSVTKNKRKECKNIISKADIAASYQRVASKIGSPNCKNSATNTITKACKEEIQDKIQSSYVLLEENNYNLKTFDEDTIGEDVFLNGNPDDSDFDLMIDVNNIGDLLFTSFISPAEILFYGFPKGLVGAGKNPNTSPTAIGTESTSATAGKNPNTSPTAIGTESTPATVNTTNKTDTTPSSATSPQTTSPLADKDITKFLSTTKQTNTDTQTNGTIAGDECLTSIPNELSTNTEETTTTATETEIAAYNTAITTFLTNTIPYKENTYVPNISTTADITSPATQQAISDKVDQLFDTGAVEQCRNKCKTLPASDKAICEIQCLCFSVSYPKYTDPKLIDMNDALKLRFCMIPVEAQKVSKQKDVLSRDEMLTRTKNILSNLINGGQMVKMQKTKEYLDNPIADLKWDKMFSFELVFNIKSIFTNKQAKAQEEKRKNRNTELEKAINNTNKSPELDKNKYALIENVTRTKADKTIKQNLSDYEKSYQEVLAKKNISTTKPNPTQTKTNVADKKFSETNIIIGEFLKKNSEFRQSITEQLDSINAKTEILRTSDKLN